MQISAVAAGIKYFGKKDSAQTLLEFKAEWDQLSEKDKAEIVDGLKKEGYDIKD